MRKELLPPQPPRPTWSLHCKTSADLQTGAQGGAKILRLEIHDSCSEILSNDGSKGLERI